MGELHRLVRRNDPEGVRAMLAESATAHALANEVDELACTPLVYAVYIPEISREILEALLAAGADATYERPTFKSLPDMNYMSSLIGDDISKPLSYYLASPVRLLLAEIAVHSLTVDKLELLHAHGTDFDFRSDAGSSVLIGNALHHAAYGQEDRVPIIRFLLSIGIDPNAVDGQGNTPLRNAYPRSEVVQALLDGGADEGALNWNPLIRAIVVGSPAEIEAALLENPDVDARDWKEMSAIEHALYRGNLDLAKRLKMLSGGEVIAPTAFTEAVQEGQVEIVEWLIEQGIDPNSRDMSGDPALQIAATTGNRAMVETLLRHGSNPRLGSIIEGVTDGPMIDFLLQKGADPRALGDEERRHLLGLSAETEQSLHTETHEQYLAERYPAETDKNPQEVTGPFRVAMIRTGKHAFEARNFFNEPYAIDYARETPIWCAARFGQSVTKLPDGRTILIAGEHDDSYDPDFCIYNDVIVFHPDGRIQIYGYPYAVFPPTDSHTATLVGDSIFIVGSIGYKGQRQTGMPVWSLHTVDYKIEPIQTSGRDPGRVFRHRADLIEANVIEITEGKRIRFEDGNEVVEKNDKTFRLDLATFTWS